MPNRVRVLTVLDANRAELERRVRAKSAPARTVERARIVLLSAEGSCRLDGGRHSFPHRIAYGEVRLFTYELGRPRG
jgi:hypothetical protein